MTAFPRTDNGSTQRRTSSRRLFRSRWGRTRLSAEEDAFRESVQRIAGNPPAAAEGPLPQFTDRAQRLLVTAKQLLDRQRAFTTDPLYAGLAANGGTDPLVGYHRETVAVLDAVVRMAQAFPNSASAQLKLCDGLDGLLGVVKDRLAMQERALAQHRIDAERIDRLAAFFTGLHTHQPATIESVAALAEGLLEDARQAKPIRFVSAPVTSTFSHPGGAAYPVPARFVAAHAINVAQVVGGHRALTTTSGPGDRCCRSSQLSSWTAGCWSVPADC